MEYEPVQPESLCYSESISEIVPAFIMHPSRFLYGCIHNASEFALHTSGHLVETKHVEFSIPESCRLVPLVIDVV